MNEEDTKAFNQLIGEMSGQIYGLKVALAMSIASDRNVRAAMLHHLPRAIEFNRSDPKNWATEVGTFRSTGIENMLESLLEMLGEAQEKDLNG